MGSSTYIGGSHLTFKKMCLEKGRKLHKYKIINHTLDQEIGEIHWRGGWRQYVSHCPDADINRSCHKEIMNFINKLMKEWRENKSTRGRTNESNNNN